MRKKVFARCAHKVATHATILLTVVTVMNKDHMPEIQALTSVNYVKITTLLRITPVSPVLIIA